MKLERVKELYDIYRRDLFEDVLPFWTKYSIDHEYGGYHHYLDCDGKLISAEKSGILNSRQLWTYSYLYNNFGNKQEWLDIAKAGYDFFIKHFIDYDGRIFFQVTRDGRPLRKRRYWIAETFAISALAEYSKAAGSAEALQKARDTFNLVLYLIEHPDQLEPKFNPQTRPMIGHVGPMLLINSAQTMRDIDPENAGLYNDTIDRMHNLIMEHLVKPAYKAVFEVVGGNGEVMDDTPLGRCISPGHGIVNAWIVLLEGQYRKDQKMIRTGLDMLDWSLEIGWDKEFGGLLYFVDLKGLPTDQSNYQMKYWWPHNEAMYALLLADDLTNDGKYEKWYGKVHEWSYKHFKDNENGEWFGYLNRDGSINLPVKGGDWKGSFHTTRMYMYGLQLLEKMKAAG